MEKVRNSPFQRQSNRQRRTSSCWKWNKEMEVNPDYILGHNYAFSKQNLALQGHREDIWDGNANKIKEISGACSTNWKIWPRVTWTFAESKNWYIYKFLSLTKNSEWICEWPWWSSEKEGYQWSERE